MPTYTYECAECGHAVDVFHSISAQPKLVCEACGSDRMVRMLGTGSGIIFKGSGFYETDYKKNGGSKSKSAASESKSQSKEKSDGGGASSSSDSSASGSGASKSGDGSTSGKTSGKSGDGA
ncbi:MAG TPA: zinc ribbon domain-containing protein [Candidatus Hydrogenedentes bacterium]|nr:zinc ribbon domain-containing protein [Candidatus Hydrogenedentota bacterium]